MKDGTPDTDLMWPMRMNVPFLNCKKNRTPFTSTFFPFLSLFWLFLTCLPLRLDLTALQKLKTKAKALHSGEYCADLISAEEDELLLELADEMETAVKNS